VIQLEVSERDADQNLTLLQEWPYWLKGYSTFFLEIGSFYNSPIVKQLSFTVFESIQLIFWYLEEYQ